MKFSFFVLKIRKKIKNYSRKLNQQNKIGKKEKSIHWLMIKKNLITFSFIDQYGNQTSISPPFSTLDYIGDVKFTYID
jgi:hypothetical protein